MGRKVRHVHAKKNEYIAVHRGGSGGGQSSSGDYGCLSVLFVFGAIYAGVWIIVNLWPILLTIAIIALIIWFRKPIWKFLKWSHRNIAAGIKSQKQKYQASHPQPTHQQQASHQNSNSSQWTQQPYGNYQQSQSPSGSRQRQYKKIVQYRD